MKSLKLSEVTQTFSPAIAMNSTTIERQKLIEAVNNLPDEALFELASFLDYL